MNAYKKFSLLAIKLGLFIVPFIPLHIANGLFFPFITGKAFFFRIVIEIVFALWVGLVLFFPEYRPKKTKLLYALGIFLGVVTLATLFGENIARSFWSNFERMEGLVMHLHLFTYFIVLSSVFRREDWYKFFSFFASAGLIQSFYALSQKLGYIASPQGGFRVDGTIGNPTYLAAYLIFVVALSLMMLFRSKPMFSRTIHGAGLAAFTLFFIQTISASQVSAGVGFSANPVFWLELIVFVGFFGASLFVGDNIRLSRIFYGTVAFASLLTIFFTATRGVMLALFVGLILAGICYILFVKPVSKSGIRWKKIVIGAFIALLLSGAGLKIFAKSGFVQNSDILSRLSSISLNEGKARFRIWNIGLEGFKEHPILGWGPENYGLVFAKYYNPALHSQEPWFDRSHMIFIDWALNAGILGLLAYLGIFATAGMLLVRTFKSAAVAGNAAVNPDVRDTAIIGILLFVYLFQNIFVFDQLATYISFFAVLAYLSFLATENVRIESKKEELGELWKGIVLGVISIGTLFMFYIGIWKPLQANKNLLEGLRLQGEKKYQEAGLAFERALSYDTFGSPETREHMSNFVTVLLQSDAPPETKERFFTKLVSELKTGMKENPLDPRTPLFLGSVYGQAGLFGEAINAFEDALKLSPKKQQIYFELADVYIRKGDYASAVATLEKSFNFAKDFSDGRVNLAAVYILNGEQAKADALLIEGFDSPHVLRPILLQVYRATKKYDRLIAIWNRYIAMDAGNVEYRKGLAGTYLEMGRKTEAIRSLEDAIRAIPSFKQDGEQYIALIQKGE